MHAKYLCSQRLALLKRAEPCTTLSLYKRSFERSRLSHTYLKQNVEMKHDSVTEERIRQSLPHADNGNSYCS